jgi:hypothetical protein
VADLVRASLCQPRALDDADPRRKLAQSRTAKARVERHQFRFRLLRVFCPARRPASSANLIWNQNIRLSPHGSLSSASVTMSAPRESNRSGNSFLVSGMLAALGASTCCEGGLKFLCGPQPEIKDGSDQKDPQGVISQSSIRNFLSY